ncbi:RNA-directed DNA polymerase, eukaryota [Tanacetum coccineum]
MGTFRSKEDDVQQISTSVFVTNFPDQFSAKDLWNTCKQYGPYLLEGGSWLMKVSITLITIYGGYWVMIKFQSEEAKKTFQSNVGIGTWFAKIQQASTDFFVEGRVAWVDIEGVPFKKWVYNTFKRIASKWGTLIHADSHEDGNFYTKRICINTNITSNILESFKIIYRGKLFWVRAKEWASEVVVMGDFIEVWKIDERFGSVFNVHGANAFNLFISNACLDEVPLGGCSYTWCHKSASKMSKLDCFLIFESLMNSCPNISAITLERFLSDHRPILMRESYYDYGPVPFRKRTLKSDLADLDLIIDKGCGDVEILAIRGILVDGNWIDSPHLVKREFLSHFKNRFDHPQDSRLQLDLNFPNKYANSLIKLSTWSVMCQKDEIKTGRFWDCGTDKSPGPDGFTFGFYRRYWNILESDVVDAVTSFFHHGQFPKGSNSSFIALIPKTRDANMVKDFRPISLIGSMYKIIAKILANRLVLVLGDLVNEVQSAFIADRQIPTIGLKQGDPLSHFLFILVMETLHISFQRIVDAAMFKGSKMGGHMSRIQSWNETIEAMASRLSKWKMKTLSIGVENVSDTVMGKTDIAFTFRREPKWEKEQEHFDFSVKRMWKNEHFSSWNVILTLLNALLAVKAVEIIGLFSLAKLLRDKSLHFDHHWWNNSDMEVSSYVRMVGLDLESPFRYRSKNKRIV